jgi:tRNA pseudouridine13 synthase
MNKYDGSQLPYLHDTFPRFGGIIKQIPQDFKVSEQLNIEFTQEGDYLYLYLEKEDYTTPYLSNYLKTYFGIPNQFAGMKDRRAVTRQWFSMSHSATDQLGGLVLPPGVKLIDKARHSEPIRERMIAYNTFQVRVRDLPQSFGAHWPVLLKAIKEKGVPNYYGSQRFGLDGDNAIKGYQLIKDRKANIKDGQWRERLFLNALQSFLFNDWVKQRIDQDRELRTLEGDVLHLGKVAGPIYGKKMTPATDSALALEKKILAQYGLDDRDMGVMMGARRALSLEVLDLHCELEKDTQAIFSFKLASGGYATSVLREILKSDIPTDQNE